MKLIDHETRSAVTRADQAKKTVTTLSREINEAFKEFQSGAEEILGLVLNAENARIKIGTLLVAAKAQLPHGKFEKFIESECPFSERTGRRFMASAKASGFKPLADLEQVKIYHALLIELGLREPAQGHGPQLLHDEPNYFVQTTKNLGAARRSLTELLEARPIAEWDNSEKSQLKEQLKPVVEVYEKL